MICAVHALVGAAVGKIAGSRGKAFAAGVATHLIGDLLPHKDLAPKVEAPLLLFTLLILLWRHGLFSPEFWGSMGGVAPDVENAAQIAGIIPRSAMRFPTHQGEGTHGPKVGSVWPQAVLALLCVWFVFRRDKGQK